MKNIVLILILIFCSGHFYGQSLVRYGNNSISKAEFLDAFRKNNSNQKATDKAYREYLNLYIRYRLKVQAAYEMKLDTSVAQRTELKNFRSQIVDQYTNDESSLQWMAREAFARSQKDLRVSYIIVTVQKNALPADTAKAWHKIQEAYKALKNNKDFNETALQYSEDPYIKNNRGDIGYITVFDLPYAIETVAYQTATGRFSAVFRTDGGYIILKKTAERPAKGRLRAAQILLIFPYQASDAEKAETHRRADSIYKAIQSGSDFGELARKFSGDNLSYQLGGVLPEFGIGKYESGFENTAYDLKKDGEVSQPYASSFGYHIIKRIKRIPVATVASQKTLDELKEKIKTDARVSVSRKMMLQTIYRQTGFKEFVQPGNVLWDYTDSLINNKKPALHSGINDQTILFQIDDQKYTVADWIVYRKSLKAAPSLTNGKTNAGILDLYKQTIAFDYYKEHLEKYNKTYAAQVGEFRDGNLLFDVMQVRVWNKASADSAGLKKYFTAHEKEYWWKPGAEAIIFNAGNASAAGKMESALAGGLHGWRKKLDSLGGQVQADSGRFEWKQIPGNEMVKPGHLTRPVANSDKSVQFAYIISNYGSSAPRTFEEAHGLVINDYQNELENQWISELKKKYPVTISESVLKTLPK